MDPQERSWIALHTSLVEAAVRALPGDSVPCFAAIGVERSGQIKHHVLGPRTLKAEGVSILDWRRAPLAAAYFTGDAELEIDGRVIEGQVVDRARYTIEGGALIELADAQRRFVREDGEWRPAPLVGPLLSPRDDAEKKRTAGSLLVELDANQRRAVELPRDRSLLVLGEAGYGKTTVALHRAAQLEAEALREGRSSSALVIVPTKGLEKLAKLTLERLGARFVEVATYDRWILEAARRAFPKLPARTSSEATMAVLRLKRHPALDAVLTRIAKKGRATVKRKDLLTIFGDRQLLEVVAGAANGTIGDRAIEEVLEHTHVQFLRSTEREHRHVDADRLETLDGCRIDAGTPMEDAGTIDVEDGAVLFELDRLRHGRRHPEVRSYDHLVLDEAQELAPIELRAIGRALAPGGSITVAGDAGQQTDDTSWFESWDRALVELGQADVERVILTESYRSPPAVTEYARRILAGTAAIEDVPESRALHGEQLATRFHLIDRLIEGLTRIERADEGATIAVVCKSADQARRIHAELERGHATRLALDGEIDFRPGTVVTEIAEVKGLELDFVIIPDADPRNYPPGPESRRALYVALTRALHGVVLLRSDSSQREGGSRQ
jgi:DNA helicase II / ATP-dependent DNA helicase PcrA